MQAESKPGAQQTQPADRFALNRSFFRSPMFPIFMIVFVDVLGFGITIPVLPLYAQNTFGADARQITLLAAVFFAAQFIASPRLGRLSDTMGRRPVLIISQLGTFAALLLSGAAPALLFVYAARAIDGFTGGNISVAQAYLNDITDTKNRARGLGIINAAFSSGFVFGPAMGGILAANFGPRIPFFVAACFSALTITLSYFMLPESLTPERRKALAAIKASAATPPPVATSRRSMSLLRADVEKALAEEARKTPTRQPSALFRRGAMSLLQNPEVVAIMVVAFGSQFAFFNFQTTYVLWAEQTVFAGHDPQFIQQAIGGVLTVIGLFGIATQLWLVGPLISRFGERIMVVLGIAGRGLAWAVMTLFPIFVPMLVVIPMMSVGGGVYLPALTALLTYSTPPERRGQAIGLMVSVQNIGSIVGPVLAGELFERVAPGAPLAAAAIISAVTCVAAIWLVRMPRHSQAEAMIEA